jgi:hypothetical protein
MRYATVTLLVIASTVTTVAIAQDGNGHGPPDTPIIIAQPGPTSILQGIILGKLSQTKLRHHSPGATKK